MAIRAITFDFWRTLFRDNAAEERRKHRVDALMSATGLREEFADTALKMTMREFHRIHVEEQRTLSPADAIPLLEYILSVDLSAKREELIESFATSVLHHSPLPIDGAFDAVRAAAEQVPVGIISDTGISPGSSVLALLERYDMRVLFESFSFSDEVGVAKPQSGMFHDAAAKLDVAASEILHIGDLEPTDVEGALRVGAQAALFAGDNDRFAGATKARYTFMSWEEFKRELPVILNGAS